MGLIIDGIAVSEAVDSSGEQIELAGMDISDFTEGRGTLNVEHRGEDAAGYSLNDIVGRITYAHKIFDLADCKNERERFFWDKVKLPYLYITAELFDDAEDGDHVGAKAAAAMIRHYHRKGLPILVRYSVEGSTLEMKDKVIKRAIARKVSLTVKPANKSCHSGLLEDNKKSPKKEGTFEGGLGGVLEDSQETKKFESPDSVRLGCSHEVECDPQVLDEAEEFAEAAGEFLDLAKALTGGGMDAAPGSLTGGSALQREDLGDLGRRRVEVVCKVALRDYDPAVHGRDFRAYLKAQLPEASDEFLDRFAELADDTNVRAKLEYLRKARRESKAAIARRAGLRHRENARATSEWEGYDPDLPEWEQKVVGGSKQQAPAGGPARRAMEREYQRGVEEMRQEFPQVRELPPREREPMTLLRPDPRHLGRGLGGSGVSYVASDPATRQSFLQTPAMRYTHSATGEEVRVPSRVHPLYAPTPEEFHEVLAENPHIQRIHDRAMDNWVVLHRLARAGKLPPEVVAHTALFSAMSPNCVDAETEALTKRGWVRGFELRRDDVLLTKSAISGALEWQPLLDLRLFPNYEGPLIEFKSRSFSIITTPEHRWLVTTLRGHIREKTSATLNRGDAIHRAGDYRPAAASTLTGDEAELLGWFVTDGFVRRPSPSSTCKNPRAFLVQSERANPEKCARIQSLLERLAPGEFSRYRYGEQEGFKNLWRVGPRLTELLLRYAPERTLTVGALVGLDRGALERLREAMLLGDGTRGAKAVMNTGRKEQADAYQALVTMTGHSASLVWRDMSMYCPTSSKLKNVPKMTGVYLVTEQKREHTRVAEWHRREFVGKMPVWCPVVENTWFVARRRGQVFITGNTPVHLQELAYAFAHDLTTHHGFDPTQQVPAGDPRWGEWEREFRGNLRNKGERVAGRTLPLPGMESQAGKLQVTQLLPHFQREYFDSEHAGVWRRPTAMELRMGKYDDPNQRVRSYVGLDEGKWKAVAAYPDLHPFLVGLVQKYGTDGHAIGSALNEMKGAYERWKARSEAHRRGRTQADPGPYEGGATMERFAPKTVRYMLGMMGVGSGVVPDTHFLRHTFGLYPGHRHVQGGDPRVDDVKRALLEARHEPLLQAIDHWYRANHPAFAHTRRRMLERYGEDFGDQATFPAFWLHWLAIPAHEKMRGWPTSARNEQADHMVMWDAVNDILDKYHVPRDPNDRSLVLRKGEREGEPTLSQRTASAMKDVEDRFGHGAATIAYHALLLPALLGASKDAELHKVELVARLLSRSSSPRAGLSNTVALLKGEGSSEESRPSRVMYRGAVVEPGEVEFVSGGAAGTRNPLVALAGPREDYHVIATDSGALARLPVKSTHYRVTRGPRVVRGETVVQPHRHAHPTLSSSVAQRGLLEGVDVASPSREVRDPYGALGMGHGWFRNAAGAHVFVKPALASLGDVELLGHRGYTGAHREAAFYRLADEAFGLGEHVPVTAVFRHPVTGKNWSAQAEVRGGHHYEGRQEQRDQLAHLASTGTLDKLAVMDGVLNSGDRHRGNYMLTSEAPGVHLIDNALTLAPPDRGYRTEYVTRAPHYWREANALTDGKAWYAKPMHSEAVSWLRQLDPDHLAERMRHLGIPEPLIGEAVRRLTAMQDKAAAFGRRGQRPTRGGVFWAPFLSATRLRPTPDILWGPGQVRPSGG